MKKTNNPCGASVILAVIILLAIVHGANGVTYTVDRSWTDGVGTASLVGTVDVALGNYTIMNGGVDPFMNVNLTLTLNGDPLFLDHADTSLIFGTGQFFIDATLSSLTFDTANADGSNPADLRFYDVTNTTLYVIDSDAAPASKEVSARLIALLPMLLSPSFSAPQPIQFLRPVPLSPSLAWFSLESAWPSSAWRDGRGERKPPSPSLSAH
jgi:hypothetical protein